MPATAELPSTATESATPFGTSLGAIGGDLMSQVLNQGIADARSGTDAAAAATTTDADQNHEQAQRQNRDENATNNQDADEQNRTQATEHQERPDDKTPTGEQAEKKDAPRIDGRTGKEQKRWSEMKLGEERDILTAAESRRVEILRKLTDERDGAAKERDDLKAEIETLRQKAAERDELDGKYKKLSERDSEREKRLLALDVRQTQEYRDAVITPWEGLFNDELKEICDATGLDWHAAYQAITTQDRKTLSALVESLVDPLDKNSLIAINGRAKAIIAKSQEYERKGADAFKEINERKSAEEKRVSEARRAEIERHRGQVAEANTKRFPFLNPGMEGLSPEFKSAVEAADTRIKDFDYGKLSPADQAAFVEAAHKGFLAANYLDGVAAHFAADSQQKADELKKANEKIAALEKRLGNQESVTLTPGRMGVDSREGKPEPFNGDAAAYGKSLIDQARAGKF